MCNCGSNLNIVYNNNFNPKHQQNRLHIQPMIPSTNMRQNQWHYPSGKISNFDYVTNGSYAGRSRR